MSSASSLPMPRPAPVTIATLPSSSMRDASFGNGKPTGFAPPAEALSRRARQRSRAGMRPAMTRPDAARTARPERPRHGGDAAERARRPHPPRHGGAARGPARVLGAPLPLPPLPPRAPGLAPLRNRVRGGAGVVPLGLRPRHARRALDRGRQGAGRTLPRRDLQDGRAGLDPRDAGALRLPALRLERAAGLGTELAPRPVRLRVPGPGSLQHLQRLRADPALVVVAARDPPPARQAAHGDSAGRDG